MEIIVVLGRVLFASFANVFQKQLTLKDHHPLFIVMASYIVLSIISIPLLLWVDMNQLSRDFWFNISFAAALDMAGTLFLVHSLSKTDLSIFGPLNAYKVVISMLLALVFLNEIPNSQGFLGIAIIIAGSCFLLPRLDKQTKQHRLRHLLIDKGVQYRFLSILLFSIGTLPLKNAVMEGQALATTIFWCLIGLPLAIISHQIFKQNSERTLCQQVRPALSHIATLGLMMFLMQYMTMIVLSQMMIAYSLALFQLSMVLHVFLGYKIFKEQHIKRRLAACLVMVIGSLLVLNA
jgi:drug/metabolite transporter (DMT)-like permease